MFKWFVQTSEDSDWWTMVRSSSWPSKISGRLFKGNLVEIGLTSEAFRCKKNNYITYYIYIYMHSGTFDKYYYILANWGKSMHTYIWYPYIYNICLVIFTIWMPNVQFAQGRAINFCSATCWNEAREAAQAPKQHWNVDNHPTAAPGLQHTLS